MRQTILVVALGGFLAACGGQSDPPTLASDDTMALPSFFEDNNPDALTKADGNHSYYYIGRNGVLAVTAGINLALAIPKAVFAATIVEEPVEDGDKWKWNKLFALVGYDSTIYAWRDGDAVKIECVLDGVGANEGKLDNFQWCDGSHTVTAGQWNLYGEDVGKWLTIDWQRASATDKTLTFTNATTGTDGSGDTLVYDLDGTTATMTVTDQKDADGQLAQLIVAWDTADGSGSVTWQSNTYCWDTIENGQVNVACP